MYYTYILKSEINNERTYIGFTNSLENRLISHNHTNNKGYTSRYKPWKIVYYFEYATKAEAMKKEKWLKSGVGREWIKANIN
jgi:putative endonuclease